MRFVFNSVSKLTCWPENVLPRAGFTPPSTPGPDHPTHLQGVGAALQLDQRLTQVALVSGPSGDKKKTQENQGKKLTINSAKA